MTDLRKLARGQPCMIRLDGCTWDTETTVLAHLRMPGICGIGQKPPDTVATWADTYCHDVTDGRIRTNLDRDFVELQALRGMARTLAELHRMGYRMELSR